LLLSKTCPWSFTPQPPKGGAISLILNKFHYLIPPFRACPAKREGLGGNIGQGGNGDQVGNSTSSIVKTSRRTSKEKYYEELFQREL